MVTHETGEARDLDRAIAALLRGEATPVTGRRDLDALTGLLVAHADVLRAAVSPPPPVAIAPRQSPRVFAATVAAAVVLLVCVALGVRLFPLTPAPAPLAPAAAAVPMAMAPVSARMMGFSIPETHAVYPPVPSTLSATVAPPVAGTARSYRVVVPGRADVPVLAAPDATASAVMTVFNGMAIEVVGERVAGTAGDAWYPVQVGAVRGFLPVQVLQPIA